MATLAIAPAERQRIYLEERARLEIRRELEGGNRTPAVAVRARPSNGVAAVLSLFIPGAGQMYKGGIGVGIVWLVVTVLGYFALIFPGLILHFCCIFHAASMEPTES
jgi:TM2 domain-containing membrane protein YozV